MPDTANILILTGMAIAFTSQFYAGFKELTYGWFSALLTIVVPGYLLLVAKRHGFYGKVVGSWMAGIAIMTAGILMMA